MFIKKIYLSLLVSTIFYTSPLFASNDDGLNLKVSSVTPKVNDIRFKHLQNEILVEIIDHLECNDILSLAGTNKKMQQLITSDYFDKKDSLINKFRDYMGSNPSIIPNHQGENILKNLENINNLEFNIYTCHVLKSFLSVLHPIPITTEFLNRIRYNTQSHYCDLKALLISSQASRLFTENRDKHNESMVLCALESLSLRVILNFFNHTSIPFMNSLDGLGCTRIIRSLAPLPKEHMNAVMRHTFELFSDRSEHDRMLIMCSFADVPKDSLHSIVKNTSLFFEKDEYEGIMTGLECSMIIYALASLSKDQMDAVTTHASKLFTEDMHGFIRSRVIRCLVSLSGEEITSLANYALCLRTDDMSQHEYYEIIKLFSDLSEEHMRSIIDHSFLLFTDSMYASDRVLVVQSLAPLSKEQMQERVRRISSLFTEHMSDPERVELIKSCIKGMK